MPERYNKMHSTSRCALSALTRERVKFSSMAILLWDAVRLQEDAVIAHDARWLPGWRFDQSDLTGRAIFRKDDAALELFTANKLPLEELFGVDLIYLNVKRELLVLVQYKMMNVQRRPTPRVRSGW